MSYNEQFLKGDDVLPRLHDEALVGSLGASSSLYLHAQRKNESWMAGFYAGLWFYNVWKVYGTYRGQGPGSTQEILTHNKIPPLDYGHRVAESFNTWIFFFTCAHGWPIEYLPHLTSAIGDIPSDFYDILAVQAGVFVLLPTEELAPGPNFPKLPSELKEP